VTTPSRVEQPTDSLPLRCSHWYYEDFVRPSAQPTNLPTFNLKSFSLKIFQSCPLLHDVRFPFSRLVVLH
jgi:hypothetical protein